MIIKEGSFSESLKTACFLLLIKPEDKIYLKSSIKNLFFEDLESLVKLGLKNIEISGLTAKIGQILYPISKLNIQELI